MINFPEPSLFLLSQRDFQSVPEEFCEQFPEITSPKRMAEFFHGRKLARQAIQELTHVDPGWIGRMTHGLPAWPKKLSGSITHTGDWACVWVAQGERAIGVDAQIWMDEDQANKIEAAVRDRHLEMDLLQCTLPLTQKMTLIFCIFEAVQKCLGNAGSPPVPPSQLSLIALNSENWSVQVKAENSTQEIKGFWTKKESFCIAFGSL